MNGSRFSRHALLGVLVAWCIALLAIRVDRTGSLVFGFLGWNLFLALLPLSASGLLLAMERRRAPLAAHLAVGVAWLLFLPNAPYILTDLLHFRERLPVPTWYDLSLLLSFAGTGLLAGYLSLADVQGVVARRKGPLAGWVLAVGTLFLSGFGIYLGRYLRYNSWEIVTAPEALLADVVAPILDPFGHPQAVAVTVMFGAMLTLGYLALSVASGAPSPAPEAPDPQGATGVE